MRTYVILLHVPLPFLSTSAVCAGRGGLLRTQNATRTENLPLIPYAWCLEPTNNLMYCTTPTKAAS